jgi:hypothetical protein
MSSELPAREPASPKTCVTLLTGGLLVRVQPEEPLFLGDHQPSASRVFPHTTGRSHAHDRGVLRAIHVRFALVREHRCEAIALSCPLRAVEQDRTGLVQPSIAMPPPVLS